MFRGVSPRYRRNRGFGGLQSRYVQYDLQMERIMCFSWERIRHSWVGQPVATHYSDCAMSASYFCKTELKEINYPPQLSIQTR